MENLKEVVQKIFETATNAPELNMANYDENQVVDLNNAMIEIYYLAEGALANESAELSNCNKPQVSKWEGIERKALLFAFIKEWKEEFKDENWDYLDFMAERFLSKQ